MIGGCAPLSFALSVSDNFWRSPGAVAFPCRNGVEALLASGVGSLAFISGMETHFKRQRSVGLVMYRLQLFVRMC